MRILIVLAVVAVATLLVITGYVAYLNWSRNLWAPVVSSLAVGVFALFASLLLTLKEETVTETFTTTVLVDEQTRLPPLLRTATPNALSQRYMDYALIARSPTTYGSGPSLVPVVKPPKSVGDVFRFSRQLVQAKVVLDLPTMTRATSGFMQVLAEDGVNLSIKHAAPARISDAVEIVGSRFVENPEGSPFFKSEPLMGKLDMLAARLPPDTRVRLEETERDHSVILEKPNFFIVTLRIEGVMGSSPGAVLSELPVTRADRRAWQTYLLSVTCSAKFSKWTAGNAHTEEYKTWVRWLFAEMERQFADR